jgi:hypothetical protein
MDIAFIAPKSLAEETVVGNYYFLLPQTITQFHKEEDKKFKMLDNGAYEGSTSSIDDLLKLAKEYGVDEIVAPDILKDYKKTFDLTVPALEKIYRAQLDAAIVPQGKDINEWILCYRQMIELKNVRTICIPKWLGRQRPFVIAHLMKNNLWKPQQFEYHLFGLDYVEELDVYRRMGAQLRSVDTSMPFTLAANGMKVGYFTTTENKRVSFQATFTEAQRKLANENMQVLREIAALV